MIRVKICGITQEDDMFAAVEAGADAIGFVTGFPYSPRNLPFKRALELSEKASPFIACVLVADGRMIGENLGLLQKSKISAIQLYGEDTSLLKKLRDMRIDVIHPVRTSADNSEKNDDYAAFLVDSYDKNREGGTGKLIDYRFAIKVKELISPKPLILSGGLTAENVSKAISIVKPYAVDVSTGVEKYPGRKDPEKIAAFVKNAKGASFQ